MGLNFGPASVMLRFKLTIELGLRYQGHRKVVLRVFDTVCISTFHTYGQKYYLMRTKGNLKLCFKTVSLLHDTL